MDSSCAYFDPDIFLNLGPKIQKSNKASFLKDNIQHLEDLEGQYE